jgi:predicted nucleic acid-binding protein
MNRKVFIDASAWVAITNRNDIYYTRASEQYKSLLIHQVMLATTSLVIAEAYVLLHRKIGYKASMTFLKGINQSPRIDIYYPDARIELEAKQILEQYADQDLSLTDAISFAFMHQEGISEAFTYDGHFSAAGFVLIG